MTAEKFLGEIGLSIPSGEKGRSVLELVWARPTAEFNGISGGYTGKGFKTVIAAEASAKISFRLVHKQDPDKIRDAFRAFVDASASRPTARSSSIRMAARRRSSSPTTRPFLTKAKSALSDEWPKPAVMIAMGGSIPIVGDFQTYLGMESLLVGFGLSDDRIHSPNEKYELSSFHKGQRSWARILDALARELKETPDDHPLPQARPARSRPLRCRRGGDRHRDAGPQPASRPALRGADLAGRRHRPT